MPNKTKAKAGKPAPQAKAKAPKPARQAKAKAGKSAPQAKAPEVKAKATRPKAKSEARATPKSRAAATPVLLSGGNPQIAKGEGDAPVQAYIAAIPDWKQEIARRLDALIVRTVKGVNKAVKWNSPFYGVEGQGWFLGYHCFTKYLKVTFFRGTSLNPVPPSTSKHPEVRYLDIYEDGFDEKVVTSWIRQASKLPGWIP